MSDFHAHQNFIFSVITAFVLFVNFVVITNYLQTALYAEIVVFVIFKKYISIYELLFFILF